MNETHSNLTGNGESPGIYGNNIHLSRMSKTTTDFSEYSFCHVKISQKSLFSLMVSLLLLIGKLSVYKKVLKSAMKWMLLDIRFIINILPITNVLQEDEEPRSSVMAGFYLRLESNCSTLLVQYHCFRTQLLCSFLTRLKLTIC